MLIAYATAEGGRRGGGTLCQGAGRGDCKPGVWQRLSKWRDSYTSAPAAKAAKVRKL